MAFCTAVDGDEHGPRQESNALTSPDDVISRRNQGVAAKSVPRNNGQAASGGAKSGAVSPDRSATDADLARIVAAWPTLPEPIRRALLALVESALLAAPEATGNPGAKGR
jgi:hypothetical protein